MTRPQRGQRQVRFVLTLALAWACGGDDVTGPVATELRLNHSAITLTQLDSAQLIPSFVDRSGTLLAGIPTTFASSNPAVATVSNVGVVTSVGPAGQSTIRVAGANLQRDVVVTVTGIPTRIGLPAGPIAIPQKGSQQLNAQLLDKVDAPIAGATFTFQSTRPNIATVSATGRIESVGPAGETTIIVQSGALTNSVQVAVTQVPTTIVAPATLRVLQLRTARISATVLDAVNTPIVGAPVSFTSLNPTLITVAADGTVSSVGPLGRGVVRVTSLGLSADVTVDVATAASPTNNDVTLISTPSRYAAAFVSADSVIGAFYGGPALMVNLRTSAFRDIPGSAAAYAVSVLSSGHALLTTGSALRRLDLVAGTFNDIQVGAQAFGLALTPDGRTAFVGSNDGKINVVDLLANQVARTITSPVFGLHLTLDASRDRLYASGGGSVVEFDLPTNSVRRTFNIVASQATALSADGRTLYVGTENGALNMVDLESGATSVMVATPDCGSWGLALTPDNHFLYLACSGQGSVKIVDVEQRSVVKTITSVGEVRRVAVSQDGSVVAVASTSGILVIR